MLQQGEIEDVEDDSEYVEEEASENSDTEHGPYSSTPATTHSPQLSQPLSADDKIKRRRKAEENYVLNHCPPFVPLSRFFSSYRDSEEFYPERSDHKKEEPAKSVELHNRKLDINNNDDQFNQPASLEGGINNNNFGEEHLEKVDLDLDETQNKDSELELDPMRRGEEEENPWYRYTAWELASSLQGCGSVGSKLAGILLAIDSWLAAGGVVSSIFILLSATLGAGCLAFPFAFKESGILLGFGMMALAAVAAFYSIHLLVICAEATNKHSYEELARYTFGRWVEVVLDVAIIVFTWGSAVAYLVIIGDTLPPLAELIGIPPDIFLAKRWFLMSMCTIFFLFPLTLLVRLSSLRFTSLIGFLATGYLIFALIVRTSQKLASDGLNSADVALGNFDTRLFVAVPIIFYGFSSHVNIFSIYREMKRQTIWNADVVIAGNIGIAFVVYGLVGLFGYLGFLSGTAANILSNYSYDDIPIQIASLAITISVILYIPLNTHPCRITLDWLFFGPNHKMFSLKTRYFFESVVIVAGTLIVAIAIPNIVVIFGLLGATATSLCCYVMPPLIHLQLLRWRLWKLQAIPSLLLALGGTTVGILSTSVIIADLIENPHQLD
jgi:sodium-coupled neutral amino acid transporter 7/8